MKTSNINDLVDHHRRNFLNLLAKSTALVSIAPEGLLASTPNKRALTKKTGYAYDPNLAIFYQAPELPYRINWINERLQQTGVTSELETLTPFTDPMKYISQVHDQDHIEGIQNLRWDSSVVPVGPTAELAAAYAINAVKAVCNGDVKNAFCAIRPPGHHAIGGGYGNGYCYYGNAAIAAKYALTAHSIKKILLIDWDLHHGNGTHSLLCKTEGVLFFDTFEQICCGADSTCYDFYAESPSDEGRLDDLFINIEMPNKSGNDDFIRLFENRLVRAAQNFKPELIIVSCGFDIKYKDTHGSLQVTAQGISKMTKLVMDIADTYAQGRIVSLLEGGYEDRDRDMSISGNGSTFSGLAQCTENHVKTLMTGEIQKETPFFSGVNVKYFVNQNSPKIRVLGNILTVPPCKEKRTLTISNIQGRLIKKLTLINTRPSQINLLKFKLAPGRYFLTAYEGAQKEIVLPITIR